MLGRFSFVGAFIAFLALVCVRLYWWDYASSIPDYLFNGTVMITSNDGYYYAEGARDILNGVHQDGDLSPIQSPLSIITASVVWLSGLALDKVILFMPAIMGALIAFPLFFIFIHLAFSIAPTSLNMVLPSSKPSPFSINMTAFTHTCAMLTAFVGGIAISYYNRTMVGYYDTDMLLLTLPLVFYYYFFKLLDQEDHSSIANHAPALMFGILACHWHHGLQNLFIALWGLVLGALVFCYFRQKSCTPFMFKKLLYALAIVSILIIPSSLWTQCTLALCYLLGVRYNSSHQSLLGMVVVFVIVAIALDCFGGVYYQLKTYLFQEIPKASPLFFYDVVNTIREVKGVDYWELGERISSHFVLFVLSIIGFVWLCYCKPIFAFSLPFVVLGLLGYKIGLRFNIFAVPFFAISLVFLLWNVSRALNAHLRFFALMIGVVAFVLPGMKHIADYKMPTVFLTQEAQTLHALKTIANPDDYLITWWDYGYGARYYGDVKTLIDGGKHSGAVNYPVSYMLTTPNLPASALLARITTEITQQHWDKDDSNLIMERIFEMYQPNSLQAWFIGLQNGVWEPPSKTHEIFYYIPFRIFDIFNTIDSFSNIDLQTGETLRQGVFYFSSMAHQEGEYIYITSHANEQFVLDMQSGFLQVSSNQIIKLKELVSVREQEHESDSFLQTIPIMQTQSFHPQASMRAIYFETQKALILTDEYHFYATILQLFMGKEHELFELVVSNPSARIYKVRHF